MRLLSGFQSHFSTTPSWAFHCICLLDGCSGLMERFLPLANSTWSLSGLHTTANTLLSTVASVLRSCPLRLHTLITPSSPAVASALPSCDHRREITAPRWASGTLFSRRPFLANVLKDPSVHETANRSLPLMLRLDAHGIQCRSVTNASTLPTLPWASPCMSHRQKSLSSLALTSSLATFQPTAVTRAVCTGCAACVTRSFMAPAPC
mmetsp:Transcript_5483/g.19075  ORF Transcript_5483/g.19075 Transcript_5483/m.19075 type:complete len:207 (+) Transcript_5483:3343-3963(+)